jgi:ribonuclease Z
MWLRSVKTVRKAADFFGGRIDTLINNGGIAAPYWKEGKTMEDPETLDQWKAYIETSLPAPFAASQACIPYMK